MTKPNRHSYLGLPVPDIPPTQAEIDAASDLPGAYRTETYCYGRLVKKTNGRHIWLLDGREVSEDEAMGFMEACEEMP